MPFAGLPSAGASGVTGTPAGKWQVSSTGGTQVRWRRDGTELFFLSSGDTLMAVAVNGRGSAFEVGAVRPLFSLRSRPNYLGYGGGNSYAVSPDGQRFLANVATAGQAKAPITLVANWTAALKE
jgi:hypothetical protein